MKKSKINIYNYIEHLNNGELILDFPILPSIDQAWAIFSLDHWKNIHEKEMIKDTLSENFNIKIKFNESIAWRFKYTLKHTNEVEYFEDREQKNYFLNKELFNIQNVENTPEIVNNTLKKGKNILYCTNYNDQLYSYILFDFKNIFYYRSILDNFDEFLYIKGLSKVNTQCIKKIDNKITWKTDLYNRNIIPNVKDILKNICKNPENECGILNISENIHSNLSMLYFFSEYNLDYLLFDNSLVWRKI